MKRSKIGLVGGAIFLALTHIAVNAFAFTFTNAGAISVPSSGSATPYPSIIVVSGVAAVINDVNVTLRGLTHAFPADLDILLVGPGGQMTLLMSDVGGGTDITGMTLTFDDAASGSVPNPINSGTFKPTNFLGGDVFPMPAPGGPYGTQLSVFNGTVANGVWRLFVFDDGLFAAGSVADGWSLDLTYQGAPAAVPEVPAVLYVGAALFVGAAWLRRRRKH